MQISNFARSVGFQDKRAIPDAGAQAAREWNGSALQWPPPVTAAAPPSSCSSLFPIALHKYVFLKSLDVLLACSLSFPL